MAKKRRSSKNSCSYITSTNQLTQFANENLEVVAESRQAKKKPRLVELEVFFVALLGVAALVLYPPDERDQLLLHYQLERLRRDEVLRVRGEIRAKFADITVVRAFELELFDVVT